LTVDCLGKRTGERVYLTGEARSQWPTKKEKRKREAGDLSGLPSGFDPHVRVAVLEGDEKSTTEEDREGKKNELRAGP